MEGSRARSAPGWQLVEPRELARSGKTSVRADRWRGPSGVTSEILSLEGPPVSLVVPVLDAATAPRVVLVRQFRPAWGLTTWECPAGHAEPGETPAEAARRELAEETGYRAVTLLPLLDGVRASAKLDAVFSLFRADDPVAGATGPEAADLPAARPDPDESLEVGTFSLDAVRGLVSSGQIVHAPSLVALLLVLGPGARDR